MRSIRIAVIMMLLLLVSMALGGEESLYYYYDVSVSAGGDCFGCHCSIYQFLCSYEALMEYICEIEPTVGMAAVYPGRPDSSVVIWRLYGITPSGDSLEIMPFKQDKLPDSMIEIWREWVAQGAVRSAPVNVDGNITTWGEIKRKYRE